MASGGPVKRERRVLAGGVAGSERERTTVVVAIVAS